MITRWSSGSPDANMAEELLTDVGHLVRRHPWWSARARLSIRLLRKYGCIPPASVLDAGCGWGVTLSALDAAGYATTGLDISRSALASLETASRRLIEADLSVPVPDSARASFDAVLALDVIEHIDDDRAVVSNLGTLVSPGGLLVVSVPARPDLFSDFDRVQGHRRRYTLPMLNDVFLSSGLSIVRTFWWGGWMVPVLRIQRTRLVKPRGLTPLETYRQFLSLPPWPAKAAMTLAFSLDEQLALSGMNPTGTSLFAIARRPLPQM